MFEMHKKNLILIFSFCLFFTANTLCAKSSLFRCYLTPVFGYRFDSFFYHLDSYENKQPILSNILYISDLCSTETGISSQVWIAKQFLFSFEGSYAFIQKGNFQEEVNTYASFSYKAKIKCGDTTHFNLQAAYLITFFTKFVPKR